MSQGRRWISDLAEDSWDSRRSSTMNMAAYYMSEIFQATAHGHEDGFYMVVREAAR